MGNENRFLGLIENGIRNRWEYPALTDYNGETLLYKDFAKKIAELHILFDTIKLQKGDKVAVCGRNSAHWVITFFASMSYGAVVTTILHDFDSDSIHNIVNHSDAKVLFAAEHIWEKIDPISIPKVDTIFLIDDFSVIKTNNIHLNSVSNEIDKEFLKKYPNGFTPDDMHFHQEEPEEMALLNYTSGTTSSPKGVMLPYRSLWSNTRFAIDKIPFVLPGDGVVCMLPMAHMYGLAFEILLSISKGCHIHFLTRIPSPQVIMDAFAKVKPTLVLSVPLIIEKIVVSRVFTELNKQPVKTLIKLPIVKNKIYAKIREKLVNVFGENLVEVVIGGAGLNKEVGDFLSRIRFPYTVGYGMTECGPLISYEYWETYKPSSCGKIVDRMEIKIDSPDPQNTPGEILVKGTNTMLGYYKNPEATESITTKDGWLNTGDLGVIDNDGNIFIKGRSKTMILGPSGQNIYPEEIEQILNNTPYVAESLIVERDGKLHALIYPDHDALKLHGIKDSDIQKLFDEEIKTVNSRIPKYSQISGFSIQDEEFAKTPKRSIKRFMYK
jgi:long-chain acyl-CoA synthetase